MNRRALRDPLLHWKNHLSGHCCSNNKDFIARYHRFWMPTNSHCSNTLIRAKWFIDVIIKYYYIEWFQCSVHWFSWVKAESGFERIVLTCAGFKLSAWTCADYCASVQKCACVTPERTVSWARTLLPARPLAIRFFWKDVQKCGSVPNGFRRILREASTNVSRKFWQWPK